MFKLILIAVSICFVITIGIAIGIAIKNHQKQQRLIYNIDLALTPGHLLKSLDNLSNSMEKEDLINKLKTLKDEILWNRPIKIDVVEERYLGFELKSQSFKPNSAASKQAAVIQEAIDYLE